MLTFVVENFRVYNEPSHTHYLDSTIISAYLKHVSSAAPSIPLPPQIILEQIPNKNTVNVLVSIFER